MPSRIRKGDTVQVIAGREKGKRGEVAEILRKQGKVLVHAVNVVKRHQKPTQQNPQGGIVDQEAPLPISNVMLVDPTDDKPTRVGFKRVDGQWVRIGRRTGAELTGKKIETSAAE